MDEDTNGPSALLHEASDPCQPRPSAKRHRDTDTEGGIEHDSEIPADVQHQEHIKRRRYDATDFSIEIAPVYLIVHCVTCNRQKSHVQHEMQSFYLDPPRLFENDCKASTLRGKQWISNVDQYLEEHPEISIVTYKNYSCNKYYERITDHFEKLSMPSHPESIKSLAVYFYRLPRDGEEAQSYSQQMSVLSHSLKDAISSVTDMHPDRLDNLQHEDNTDTLYHLLYHCRRLKNEGSLDLGDLHRRHLDILIECVNASFIQEYDEADTLFARGHVTQIHLAKLFGPKDIVVTYEDGQPRAFVLERSPESNKLPIALDCWSWEFDGLFRQEKTTLYVDWTSSNDEIAISDLSVYPLRFDQSGIEEKLRKRGEMFWRCRKEKLVSYAPQTTAFQMQTSNPRYMIDMNTYREINDISDLPPQRDDIGREAMSIERPPGDSFVLLLPTSILGFGFHDRKWRSLSIEYVSDVDWNMKAFEHLVIDEEKKNLVKALVTTHTAASKSTDFMEGKGNGLIILLHGGPGTGKTLTAESVAELTTKPLYRIACGDIGTNAEDVEKYLVSVFYIGTIWKCVVLLDEADVFLEERKTDQLERNALVSVFLRALEYYDGILILTSNRVATFDEAFKSRVQISLHYPRLDKESRSKIWLNFIDSLSETDARVDKLRNRAGQLAKKSLNGREIRNTMKSAMQLAKFNKEQLDYGHLETVIGVSTEFTAYLKKAHGHSASEYAESQGYRAKD